MTERQVTEKVPDQSEQVRQDMLDALSHVMDALGCLPAFTGHSGVHMILRKTRDDLTAIVQRLDRAIMVLRPPAKLISPNLFKYHRCSVCNDGESPCTEKVPGNCGNPIAIND